MEGQRRRRNPGPGCLLVEACPCDPTPMVHDRGFPRLCGRQSWLRPAPPLSPVSAYIEERVTPCLPPDRQRSPVRDWALTPGRAGV